MAERTVETWNDHYARDAARWDLGGAPPVLERLLESEPEAMKVLVPGAGKGNDALAWARAGHAVTAVDYAPLAIEIMGGRASEAGLPLEVVQADVTQLPDSFAQRFDRIWEQTCLCALPPRLRRPYLEQARRALRPGGEMLALLWNHGRPEGPPFDMSHALVEDLLDGLFRVRSREPVVDSTTARVPEFLWRLEPLTV